MTANLNDIVIVGADSISAPIMGTIDIPAGGYRIRPYEHIVPCNDTERVWEVTISGVPVRIGCGDSPPGGYRIRPYIRRMQSIALFKGVLQNNATRPNEIYCLYVNTAAFHFYDGKPSDPFIGNPYAHR